MVAKSIAKMYTNIHKPTDYCLKPTPVLQLPVLAGIAPCWHKVESSHSRLGTESSETRLAHPTRHHK